MPGTIFPLPVKFTGPQFGAAQWDYCFDDETNSFCNCWACYSRPDNDRGKCFNCDFRGEGSAEIPKCRTDSFVYQPGSEEIDIAVGQLIQGKPRGKCTFTSPAPEGIWP